MDQVANLAEPCKIGAYHTLHVRSNQVVTSRIEGEKQSLGHITKWVGIQVWPHVRAAAIFLIGAQELYFRLKSFYTKIMEFILKQLYASLRELNDSKNFTHMYTAAIFLIGAQELLLNLTNLKRDRWIKIFLINAQGSSKRSIQVNLAINQQDSTQNSELIWLGLGLIRMQMQIQNNVRWAV